MTEKKVVEQNNCDIPEKKDFIEWVKDNKKQILLAGISVSTLVMTIIGIKNKDAINALWKSTSEQIKKGSLYSEKWYKNASLAELEKQRELVLLDSLNPDLDMDYRVWCIKIRDNLDNAIRKAKGISKDVGFPVHSSNGWHLPSDD